MEEIKLNVKKSYEDGDCLVLELDKLDEKIRDKLLKSKNTIISSILSIMRKN